MSNLYTQNIPNLINGVSQQASSLRRPDQCAEQINCRNSLVEGMGKRHNTTLGGAIANATDAKLANSFIHTIYRDAFEHYKIIIHDGTLRVIDAVSGVDYPVDVLNNDALTYFRLESRMQVPKAYSALTTFDTTLLLNKTAVVKHIPVDETLYTPLPSDQRTAVVALSDNPKQIDPDASPLYTLNGIYSHYEFKLSGGTVTKTYNYEPGMSLANIVAQLAAAIETEYGYDADTQGDILYVTIPENETLDLTGTWSYVIFGGTSGHGDGHTPADELSHRETDSGDAIKSITYQATAAAPPSPDKYEALWHIKQADYATSYTVEIDSHACLVVTPEATTERARAGLDTLQIASDMRDAINAKTADHGCTATTIGSSVHIVNLSTDFLIKSSDSLGSNASVVFKSVADDVTELPKDAPIDFVVRIENTETENAPYWVKYQLLVSDGTTSGSWVETVKPNIPTKLDPRTMPVRLKRKQDKTYRTTDNPLGVYFELDLHAWDNRTVGDDDTAPLPAFCSELDEKLRPIISKRIRGMLFHKNRLCMLTEENCVFSETGEYTNFFPKTVATILDTDPIDVYVEANEAASIEHALSASNELLLFSGKQQVALQSGDQFNIETVRSVTVSNYDMDTTAPPVAVGSDIYFAAKGTRYSRLREFYDEGNDSYRADDVSEHVPSYIEGTVEKIVSSEVGNYIFLVIRGESGQPSSTMYVYNHHTVGGKQKVQSAWQRWTFAGQVIDASVYNGRLDLILRYDEGPYRHFVESIDLGRDVIKEQVGHPVFLDQRVEHPDDQQTLMPGHELVSYEHILPDDTSVMRYFSGIPYTQRYKMSQLWPRQDGKALTGGHVVVRNISLNFNATTYFKTIVERFGRDPVEKEFTGRNLDSIANLLNVVPIEAGEERVRIKSKSENANLIIENDSPQDAVFQSADWEAIITNRARRT